MLKKVRQVSKKPRPGNYSLDEVELDWMTCREQFVKALSEKDKGFFFSHEPNKSECVVKFIEKTEEVLIRAALQNIQKSKFSKTNLNFALWIEPSRFWMKCPMKRSLFTMLLRCGLNYDSNNYEEALFSTDYSRKTKNAIQRFFYGFTECSLDKSSFIGIGKGWVNCFGEKNIETICERLKLPDYLDKNKFLFGEEILWN